MSAGRIEMRSISNDRYTSQVRLDSASSDHRQSEREDFTNYEDDDDNRLIFNFNDWILRYGVKKGLKYDTFTDAQGVLRYLDTWEVADPLQSDLSNQRRMTQCGQTVIPMPITHSRRRGKNATEYHQIRFLDNFRSLWAYLDMDRDDAFADFLPLFHHYVRFFSHRRTVQFMLLVAVYDIIGGIVLSTLYSVGFLAPILDGAVKVMEITVYCLLVMYFNGYLLKPPLKQQSEDLPSKADATLHLNGRAAARKDPSSRQHIFLLD